MPNHLQSAYLKLVKTKEISLNEHQLILIKKLDCLLDHLNKNNDRLFKKKFINSGIYIHGDVGRGKSLIMDLFFAQSKCKKKRIHFHEMMQDIHHNLHVIRKHQIKINNPLKEIAKNYAKKYALLCFDEFQVTDVADAMILEQLFRYFFKYNIVIITTSNRHPSELYKGGLQREKYLEFVNYLAQKLEIFELKGKKDYRIAQISTLEQTYFYPINPINQKKIQHLFSLLTAHSECSEHNFEHLGRKITIDQAASSTAIIDFNKFCKEAYSVSDYHIICANFSTIFFVNIPKIKDRNEAKRFMNFIDILYDKKINVLFLAETVIEEIYQGKDGSFEFKRCTSRITEMLSNNYIKND